MELIAISRTGSQAMSAMKRKTMPATRLATPARTARTAFRSLSSPGTPIARIASRRMPWPAPK